MKLPGDVKRKLPPYIVAGILLALLALYFGPVLTGGKSLYARDLFNFHYPLWSLTANSLRQLHIPCWNPLSHFGQSVSGNPNYLAFYPLAWIRAVIEPVRALNLFIVMHLFLGGLAAYFLLLRWRLGRVPAFFGAAFYCFSGVSLSLTCILNLMPYVLLAPALLLALEIALSAGSRLRGVVPLALVVAAVWTVFEPIMAAGLAAISIFRLGSAWKRRSTRLETIRRLPWIGAALLAGALVAAPAVVEGYRLLGQTLRGEKAATTDRAYCQHPLLTHSFWISNPFDLKFDLQRNFSGQQLTGGRYPYFFSMFIGMGTLVPILCAFWGPRRRLAWALLGGAAGFLVLSWGGYLPVAGDQIQGMPLLKWARYTQKYIFFVQGFLLALAALGLQQLRIHVRPLFSGKPLRLLAVVIAVLLVAAGPWAMPGSNWAPLFPLSLVCVLVSLWLVLRSDARTRAGPLAAVLVGCVLLFEIMAGNRFAIPSCDRRFLDRLAPVLEAVGRRGDPAGDGRVAMDSPMPDVVYYGKTDSDIWIYSFYKMAGYPFGGFTSGTYYAFNESFDRMDLALLTGLRRAFDSYPLDLRVRLMQRLGVRYYISPRKLVHPDLALLGVYPTGANYQSALYEVRGGEGRVTIASRYAYARGDAHSVALLLQKPEGTVYLEPNAGLATGVPTGGGGWDGASRRVSVDDRGDSVLIDVRESEGGILVLRDAYYPGWRAFVDGREVPVRKADFFFRGVTLEPGDHRVTFRYDPVSLRISRWASLLAILLLAGVAVAPRRLPE